MAISFINSAIPTGNPTTSYTITIPTVAVDDILILSNTNRDSNTDPAVTDNEGAGAWAKVGGSLCCTVWWKRATSATSAKVITAGSQTGSCSGVLKVYRGCRLGTPYENVTAENNLSGDESHAAITPTRDGCMVILCIGNDSNDLATTTHAATNPSTLSLVQKLSTGGSDCSNGQAHGLQTGAAGSTGTLSWAQVNGISDSVVLDLMPAFTLTAAAGSYAYSGNAATLLWGHRLEAAQGSYAYTGNAATLTHQSGSTYTLTAESGSYAYTGFAANLALGRTLTAEAGAYAYTGFGANLLWHRRLVAEAGGYSYNGFDATLTYSGGGGGGGAQQRGGTMRIGGRMSMGASGGSW